MLHLKHDKDNILDFFDLSEKEYCYLIELWATIMKDILKKKVSVSWAIERVFIDEQLSDNGRCFLVFGLGRLYSDLMRK